jgi:hypothetical protein
MSISNHAIPFSVDICGVIGISYRLGVNGARCEWAVGRLVVGYLVPVVDRLLICERTARSHPPTADSDSDVSVRGDVDLLAQPRFGSLL